MTPGQCHLISISQQTCPGEDFLQAVCSKTNRWHCGPTSISTYTFISRKIVHVYDSVNRSLPASAPCRKTVCRGDERSVLRNWMKKERSGERGGGAGWRKQYQTDTALQGRKNRVNACVQRICK